MAVVKQTTGIGIVYMCGLMPHASLPGEQLPSASIIYLSPGVCVTVSATASIDAHQAAKWTDV